MSDTNSPTETPSQPAPEPSSSVKNEGAAASADGTPAEDHLTLKVTDNNTEVMFRVKPTTSLNRLIHGFCKRTSKDRASLRFLFDGERVNDDDTPKSLGMIDGDVIEVLSQQVGGC